MERPPEMTMPRGPTKETARHQETSSVRSVTRPADTREQRTVPFRRQRPPEPRQCAICEIPLSSSAPSWWRLCWNCFKHAQLARALAVFQSEGDV